MNMRGVMAASMTNLAAACGGIAWCLIDYGKMKGQKRWSVVSVCNGAIAGLVGITPGTFVALLCFCFRFVPSVPLPVFLDPRSMADVDDPDFVLLRFAHTTACGFVGMPAAVCALNSFTF